ncbi:MAG: DpnII family type II restriction endonuclease [Chitinophagales bacterium]
MSEQFKTFLSQLSETNATLDYFTDFKKIKGNVNKISIKLNQLNYLIGKENLGEAVQELFDENPKVFEVLDILIAVRKNKKAKTFNSNGDIVLLDTYFHTSKSILEYIEETGLGDVFRNKNITNLVDYVFGIEVGLDTNARKNRGGENMSKAVSLFFDKAEIHYKKEVSNTVFPEIISLGALVISQRPSEISETILAQVGTYIALRLTNSSDQSIVKSSAPDNLNSLIDLLPALRTGEAIIVGEAIKIPSRVRIKLNNPRPTSDDPKLVEAWKKAHPENGENYKIVVTKIRQQKF